MLSVSRAGSGARPPSLVDRAVLCSLADEVLLDVSLEEHRACKLGIPVQLRRAASSTLASTSGPGAAPAPGGVPTEALLKAEQASRAEEAAWAAHLAKGGGSTKASSKARVDIFGKSHPAVAADNVTCPHCARPVVAGRYAPHLEKCMGRGRKAARVANAGFAIGGRRTSGVAESPTLGSNADSVGPEVILGDEDKMDVDRRVPTETSAPVAAPVPLAVAADGGRAMPYLPPNGLISVASLPPVGSGRPLPVPKEERPKEAEPKETGAGAGAATGKSKSKSKGSKMSKAAQERAEKAALEKAGKAAGDGKGAGDRDRAALPPGGVPNFMDFDGDAEIAMPMDLSVLGDFGGDDDWLAGISGMS